MRSTRTPLLRFLFATSLGTFLEFFDLALYSFCSSIIAKNFFPAQTDAHLSILLTWGVFAVSYLMRPLGAMWFGYIADVRGGKRAMLLSMLFMALATCGIGLLPTYATIGVAAPILLLSFRIIQSIAVSPEYNLASVFIKNNAWCERHYGFVSSISAAVTGLGMLSASWLMSTLLDANIADVAQYKWRLPFIISGLLVGTIGIYFRWNINETQLQSKPKTVPISLVFKQQRKDFVFGIFIAGYIGCITYALFSFLVHQLQVVRNMTPGAALAILSYGTLIPASFSLLAGFCSDYIPRYLLMLTAAVVITISGYTLFSHLDMLSESAIIIRACIMLAGLGFFAGGFPGFLAELFAKPYRYTGSFLAYNIGMSWIGGVCPLLFIGLAKIHANLPLLLISIYSLLIIYLLLRPSLSFETRQTHVV